METTENLAFSAQAINNLVNTPISDAFSMLAKMAYAQGQKALGKALYTLHKEARTDASNEAYLKGRVQHLQELLELADSEPKRYALWQSLDKASARKLGIPLFVFTQVKHYCRYGSCHTTLVHSRKYTDYSEHICQMLAEAGIPYQKANNSPRKGKAHNTLVMPDAN